MEKAKRKNDRNPLHIIEPQPFELSPNDIKFGLVLFLTGLVSLLLAFIIQYDFLKNIMIVYATFGIGFPSLVLLMSMVHSQIKKLPQADNYIAIYEDGLEICSESRAMFSSWENMIYLATGHNGEHLSWGIILYQPAEIYDDSSLLKRFFSASYNKRFLPLSHLVNIPLYGDGCLNRNYEVNLEKFSETEFGEILLEFAPHLFETRREIH